MLIKNETSKTKRKKKNIRQINKLVNKHIYTNEDKNIQKRQKKKNIKDTRNEENIKYIDK